MWCVVKYVSRWYTCYNCKPSSSRLDKCVPNCACCCTRHGVLTRFSQPHYWPTHVGIVTAEYLVSSHYVLHSPLVLIECSLHRTLCYKLWQWHLHFYRRPLVLHTNKQTPPGSLFSAVLSARCLVAGCTKVWCIKRCIPDDIKYIYLMYTATLSKR